MVKVEVRPPLGTDPDEAIVSLERDSAGAWWHVVGGEPVRQATPLEVLLPASPRTWQRLGTPAKETS